MQTHEHIYSMNSHAHGSFNHLDFIHSLVQFDLFKLLFCIIKLVNVRMFG